MDLSPAEQASREAAGIPLDAALTEQEIAAREAERDQILASVGAAVAESEPTVTASQTNTVAQAKGGVAKLAALTDAEHAGRRAAEEADHAKATAMIEPHKTAGHAALTTFGILKAKYGDRVAQAADLDVRAIRKRVPPQIVPGLDHAPNHVAISFYINLARELADDFRVFKPVDFLDSVRHAEASAYRGSASPEFQNVVKRHLPVHVARLATFVAGVENGCVASTRSKRRSQRRWRMSILSTRSRTRSGTYCRRCRRCRPARTAARSLTWTSERRRVPGCLSGTPTTLCASARMGRMASGSATSP